MAEPTDLILIGKDGSVRAATRGAERRLRDRSGRYVVTVDTPGVLMLRRLTDDDEAPLPPGARVVMAGEIMGRMTMLEMINVIANSGWRGVLGIHGADGTNRTMHFDQGAVKYASSDHPNDLLGEVLYRQGVLDRRTLDDMLREIDPDKRFGQLVVERGILTQEQLFRALQKQVEHIFFSTLLVEAGTYAFCTPDESSMPPAHTVHISVQALLMEGVQRIDEMALFRERIPSSEMCPVLKVGAPHRSLDGTAMTVLGYCDGSRTIEDIARETGLGEFHTTKTIYHLLSLGQVELHQSAKVDDTAIRTLVGAFNTVLRDIFVAVATYGGIDRTRKTLSAWIQGSGYAPYFGKTVDEDGSIDPGIVVEGLRTVQIDRPIEALHQALHELVAFALFSATTALPRDQELVLARDVNHRLKQIRI